MCSLESDGTSRYVCLAMVAELQNQRFFKVRINQNQTSGTVTQSSDLEVSGCKSSDFSKDIRYFSYKIIKNSLVFEGQFHVYGAFFILFLKKHECIKRFAYFQQKLVKCQYIRTFQRPFGRLGHRLGQGQECSNLTVRNAQNLTVRTRSGDGHRLGQGQDALI